MILNKDKEIKEATIKQQRSYLLGSIFGISGLLFGVYYLFQRNKKEKELYEKDVSALKKSNQEWYEKVQRYKKSKKNIILTDDDFLKLEDNESTLQIPLKNLLYIESDGNYLNIFYQQNNGVIKKHFIRHTLKSFQDQYLPDLPFSRINKSTIINMNYIKQKFSLKVIIKVQDFLKNFNVGRAYKDQFTEAYNSLPDSISTT